MQWLVRPNPPSLLLKVRAYLMYAALQEQSFLYTSYEAQKVHCEEAMHSTKNIKDVVVR